MSRCTAAAKRSPSHEWKRWGGQDNGKEVVLAGTFQSALGGSNWNTDDSRTRMTKVAPSVYTLQTRLPKGSYEYKVTRGGSFDENYGVDFKAGGANIPLVVQADDTPVLFEVDFNAHTIQTSVDTPGLTSFCCPGIGSGEQSDAPDPQPQAIAGRHHAPT